MNILGICPYYKPAYVYGGPARSVPLLFEGLAAFGHHVSVFTTNANGNSNFISIHTGIAQSIDGVSVTYYPRDIQGSFFFSRGLSQACVRDAKQFDVIYLVSTWGYPFIPGALSALMNSKPYIISPRTAFMEKTWKKTDLKKWFYHWLFERPLLNRSIAIHYTTTFEQSESAWLGLRPPSFIVPNPVAMQEFQSLPARGIFRTTLNLPSAARIVLYLGRVEHRKGIDLALNAFAQVSHQIPEAYFIIAGPSEDHFQKTLEVSARELGVFEKVIFTGYLNQAQRLSALADADVFILTSRSENFGMSVVEAMASRLPVVVSDTVGIADDIVMAQAGRVVPLQVPLIAKALEDLLLSEELRKSLGDKARSLALKKYSCSDIAKAFDFQLKQRIHGPV